MSIASSRPPEEDFSKNSQQRSFYTNELKPDPDQKPIMRLMRQQKSYLLQQNQPSTISSRPNLNITPTGELKNLKQFERSLQKQRPSQIQIPNNINNSYYNSTKKSSAIASPKGQFKQKFVTSFMINESTIDKPNEEQDQIAFHHRVMETQKYGNENLEKIKKLIVNQMPSKSPKSPKRKKTQLFSYNATSSTQKLHKSYLKTESDRRDQYIKKFYADEMRQIKPFKIDNPMSQFLADKRAQKQGIHKPLYERSIELAKKIQQTRLQKQLLIQEQKRLKNQEEEKEFQEIQKQKYPNSSTKQHQQKFYNQMMQRQKQKNQLKQQQKISHLKQVTKQKPFISKASQELFNKIVQKKDIPRTFIERNMEYCAQREKEKIREMQKHDQQYCPFAPKISEASREKAKKYYERKEKNLESPHKECQKDLVLEKDELQKKLKMIEQKIREKKHLAENNFHQHKRVSSALLMGIKNLSSDRELSKDQKVGKIKSYRDQTNNKKGPEIKEEEIPIYNRSDYGNRRTNSCFNLKWKK